MIISERVPFLLIYCGAVILLWTNSETDCEYGFEQIRASWFESFNEYAYLNQNYLMNTHILLRIIYNQSNRHHSWKKWICPIHFKASTKIQNEFSKACWTIINQIMQDNFYSAKDKIIDVVGFNSSIGYVYAAVRK